MSAGTYHEGQLTITGKEPLSMPVDESRSLKWKSEYDLRTIDQHIAALDQRLKTLEQEKISSDTSMARLEERFKDLSVLYTQLQEIIRGEPPFSAPEGNWTPNE